MLQSSAYRANRRSRRSNSRSNSSSTMLLSKGDNGPPWGVPSSTGLTSPPSITPARRNARIRMCRTPGTKPVAVFGKRPVPSALQHLHHRLLDETIKHGGDAEFSHPSIRLVDFHSFHRLRHVGSAQQLFPNGWPMLLEVSRKIANRHTVHAGTPFVRLDSCQCLLTVLLLADFLHQPFANGRAFRLALRRERFGPFSRGRRSFTPTLLPEGQH